MLDIRWPLTWAPFPICVQVDRDHAQLKRQVALLPSFIFPRSNGVFCLSSASSVPTSSCTDSDTDEDLSPSPLALLLTFVNVRPIRRHIETLSLSGLGYFDFLRACPNQIRVGMDFLCLSFQTSLAWFARFKSDILHFGTRSAASVNVGFIKLEQVETPRAPQRELYRCFVATQPFGHLFHSSEPKLPFRSLFLHPDRLISISAYIRFS